MFCRLEAMSALCFEARREGAGVEGSAREKRPMAGRKKRRARAERKSRVPVRRGFERGVRGANREPVRASAEARCDARVTRGRVAPRKRASREAYLFSSGSSSTRGTTTAKIALPGGHTLGSLSGLEVDAAAVRGGSGLTLEAKGFGCGVSARGGRLGDIAPLRERREAVRAGALQQSGFKK